MGETRDYATYLSVKKARVDRLNAAVGALVHAEAFAAAHGLAPIMHEFNLVKGAKIKAKAWVSGHASGYNALALSFDSQRATRAGRRHLHPRLGQGRHHKHLLRKLRGEHRRHRRLR